MDGTFGIRIVEFAFTKLASETHNFTLVIFHLFNIVKSHRLDHFFIR